MLIAADITLSRVTKVEVSEPRWIKDTSWVGRICIVTEIPGYMTNDQKPRHTKTEISLMFHEEPDWSAGVIYEVPDE